MITIRIEKEFALTYTRRAKFYPEILAVYLKNKAANFKIHQIILYSSMLAFLTCQEE